MASSSNENLRDLENADATFQALGRQFDLDEKVVKHLLGLGIKTLSEFRFFVNDENEVKTVFVDPVKDLDNPRLQVSRLRHAWTSCKALITQQQDQVAQGPKPEDEELILPAADLQELKNKWFRRYHLKPAGEVMPSDRLISKVARNLKRNQLEVFDMWAVRSLLHQKTHTTKRRKIADGLYTEEDDESETLMKTADNYLVKLETYLLALSIAGCQAIHPAPTAAETWGTHSYEYVRCPPPAELPPTSQDHDSQTSGCKGIAGGDSPGHAGAGSLGCPMGSWQQESWRGHPCGHEGTRRTVVGRIHRGGTFCWFPYGTSPVRRMPLFPGWEGICCAKGFGISSRWHTSMWPVPSRPVLQEELRSGCTSLWACPSEWPSLWLL